MGPKKILFISIAIFFFKSDICADKADKSKDDLIEKIKKISKETFIDKPIEQWLDKDKFSQWTKLMEEVGVYVQSSGSTDLPPIYNKYFKPRYGGYAKPWSGKSDVFTDIFYEIAKYLKLKDEGEKRVKFSEITGELKNIQEIASKEIIKTNTYFKSKTLAKNLLLFLVNNILVDILKKLIDSKKGDYVPLLKVKIFENELPVFDDYKHNILSWVLGADNQLLLGAPGKGGPIKTLNLKQFNSNYFHIYKAGNFRDKTLAIIGNALLSEEFGDVNNYNITSIVSNNDKYVLIGRNDTIGGEAQIWDFSDMNKPKKVKILPKNKFNSPLLLTWDIKNNTIVGYSYNGYFAIWDVKDIFNPVLLAESSASKNINILKSNPNDNNFVTYDNQNLQVWQYSLNEKIFKNLQTYQLPDIKFMEWDKSGKYLLVSTKNNFQIFDFNKSQLSKIAQEDGKDYSNAIWCDNNSQFIACWADQVLKLFSFKDAKNIKQIAIIPFSHKFYPKLIYNYTGNYLILADISSVYVADIENYKKLDSWK